MVHKDIADELLRGDNSNSMGSCSRMRGANI